MKLKKLRQFACGLAGHTWECWRTSNGLGAIIGWRCAHCGKFRQERPSGLLDRHWGPP